MSYYVNYWSTNPKTPLLGGVQSSQSSRFETKKMAQDFLDTAIVGLRGFSLLTTNSPNGVKGIFL